MRLFLIFATFVGLAIYGVSLQAPYYLDDVGVLETARRLNLGIRPLGYLSFWLNNHLYDAFSLIFPWKAPAYFRLVNVLIHILCSCAVFWLVRELSGKKSMAAIAASLFLVHPIQTQAVTYITQRFESQAALFMVCAAAAYVRFRRTGSWNWLAAVLLFAAAGGATKETGMILPVWLGLIEVVFFSRIWPNLRILYGLPLVIVVAYPAWKTYLQSGPTLTWIPWDLYLVSQGPVLAKYIQLAVFPVQQFLLYDVQPVSVISASFLLQWIFVLFAAGTGVYFLAARRPLIGFGIISFFVLLLPVTVLPLPDLVFEHRVYPAFCGFAIAAAAAISTLPRRVMIGVTGMLLLILGTKTIFRNAEYNEPISFFEAHRDRFPEGAFALLHLGNHYLGMGEVNKALAATEQARKNEGRFNVYYQKVGQTSVATDLGLIHLAKQQYDIAEAEAHRALAITPGDPLSLLLLGNIYLETERSENARKTFEKLVKLTPDDATSWRWYREACLKVGDTEAAGRAQARIDEHSEKAKREETRLLQIPARYRNHVVFLTIFLTMALLVGIGRYASVSQPRSTRIARTVQ